MNSQMKRYVGEVWKGPKFKSFCLGGVEAHEYVHQFRSSADLVVKNFISGLLPLPDVIG